MSAGCRFPEVLLLTLLVTAAAVGCGGSSSAHAPSRPNEVEVVWRSKCGACHVPIEPGSRARPEVEKALARHRMRMRLTEQQWTAMVDFLAPPRR